MTSPPGVRKSMQDQFETAHLLPRLAELRRNASSARRLAQRVGSPIEVENLSRYAEHLDRDADAIEVRLAILRAAQAASDPSAGIAALRSSRSG